MKIFIADKFKEENYKEFNIITPREVQFNDYEAWINLIYSHLDDEKCLIVFPEAYLNIVQAKELLPNIFKEQGEPKCSFFTHSPYITPGELSDYIICN